MYNQMKSFAQEACKFVATAETDKKTLFAMYEAWYQRHWARHPHPLGKFSQRKFTEELHRELAIGLDPACKRYIGICPYVEARPEAFITECCTLAGQVPKGELYAAYERWANEQCLEAVTRNKFGRTLYGVYSIQPSSGGKLYIGVSLCTPDRSQPITSLGDSQPL